MLKIRIIPCLDVKDGRVVKGINFLNLIDAGDPVEQANFYSKNHADEICFLDISASLEKRKTMADVVKKTAEKVFIPYPSYNQDHKAVYEASLIALRPHDINFFVKKVLVYEQPHVFLWDHSHSISSSFKPNYFVPIDMERKKSAYLSLESQVRSFRSPEFVEELAKVRGRQANLQFAEAFEVIRWVD